MPPTYINRSAGRQGSTRLVSILFSITIHWLPNFIRSVFWNINGPQAESTKSEILTKRSEFNPHEPRFIVFAVLIPVLVLLSGLFAGLTLGYMSLDETQLNVLSISGTPQQREYARKIKPIRKNGHLLLVTLLLANMITNETLPVIADPVLGGGVQSVAVSTVLIVLFAEIIPQSLFTRHGLYLGAKCAGLTKFLIYAIGIISWPVSKILEFVLGSHHGIIYRRAELKELIAMHSSMSPHGGDLNTDTVTIIGATLDLQEKVVEQAMTPISDAFMLSIDSRLDYSLLKKICDTGHSRIPVYEEFDAPPNAQIDSNKGDKAIKMRKIIGILLVKQCVLLDPEDATPLRKVQLNKVFFVPKNESLLSMLDKFQEGRSHMAIVSRFSVEQAKVVKKAVKKSLTQRLKKTVGMDDTEDEDEDETDSGDEQDEIHSESSKKAGMDEEKIGDSGARGKQKTNEDIEGILWKKSQRSALEQSMPADAVLEEEGANEFLQQFDPAVMPVGIITLEDVLEELIGEEIYDEFDAEGARGDAYIHTTPGNPLSVSVAKPQFRRKRRRVFRSTSAPPVNEHTRNERKEPSSDNAQESPLSADERDRAEPNKSRPPTLNHPLEAVLLSRRHHSATPSIRGVGGAKRPRPDIKKGTKSGPVQTTRSQRSNTSSGHLRGTDQVPHNEVKEDELE